MIRSDGGAETRRYYKGSNTFPLAEAASKAAGLLEAGRAVIVMEPTNRFTNRLTALLRMDRDRDGRGGIFTVEVLGPGYDVADLTRGGIPPQVTVTAETGWSAYPDLWWSDLKLTADTSPDAEQDRRRRRLTRIAADILTAPATSMARPPHLTSWPQPPRHGCGTIASITCGGKAMWRRPSPAGSADGSKTPS